MIYPVDSIEQPGPELQRWNFGSDVTVRPRPSAPQGQQCEMSHFLANVGARVKVDILVHINVVVNWQMPKQGIRRQASQDRFAGSGDGADVFDFL